MNNQSLEFSVAPMMKWTDHHCRYFHRLITKKALLYSEMISEYSNAFLVISL